MISSISKEQFDVCLWGFFYVRPEKMHIAMQFRKCLKCGKGTSGKMSFGTLQNML